MYAVNPPGKAYQTPQKEYELTTQTEDNNRYREEAGPLAEDEEGEETTNLEKAGWLLYGVGTEPYNSAVNGVFIPLILESLASSSGYELDGITPCNISQVNYQCVNYFGSSLVDTASYSLYITCISVVIQFFIFVQLGAIADHGRNKKKFLLFFAFLGSVALLCFLAVQNPKYYNAAGFLAIFVNVTFGASIVFWYAYLPTLTRHDPVVLQAKRDRSDPEKLASITDRVMNTLSSHGFATGYIAGCIFLVLCAIILYFKGQDRSVQTLTVAVGGIWWGFWTIFTALWLHSRPGTPLPENASYLTYSWKRTFSTVRQFRLLSETFKFLITWFILSDGVNTTTTVAVFFAKKQLGMTNFQLIIAAILIPLSAGIGNYLFLYFQRLTKWSTKSVLILLCALWCLLPIYGLIGFLDIPFGLKSINELYGAAVYEGLILGAIQSYCRVLFTELLPRGHENEFFSLYEVTDKGSSWLGPLVIGLIDDKKHDMRYGFYWILVSLAIPILAIWSLDVHKGREDAVKFVELEEKQIELSEPHPGGYRQVKD